MLLHCHLLLVACVPLEVCGWAPSPFLLVPQRRRNVASFLASPHHHHHQQQQQQQQQQPSREAKEESTIIRRYNNQTLMFDHNQTPVRAVVIDEDQAAEQTWNWCQHFVVPYNLCPWAAASVQAAATGAIQIYVVPPSLSPSTKLQQNLLLFDGMFVEKIIHYVANEFYQKLRHQQLDPNTAIAFVVVADHGQTIDFGSFYEWFIDLEDRWLEAAEEGEMEDRITLAPFHPDWHFGANDQDDGIDNDDNNLALNFEKKSPFPTISIVSAEVIDKAGEAATKQIGINNAKLLQSKSAREWEILYDQAVRLPTRNGGQDDATNI